MKVHLIAAVILSFVSVSGASNTIYVDANSPSDPGTGTLNNPFRKIQDALNYSSDSDIVEIRPGVYTGPGNYNLDPAGKSITIRSLNPQDANTVASTIIDPDKADRAFILHTNEDPNCILSGLTIRNGHAADDSGGGIYCFSSSPTISRCVIINNTADVYGGGIYCYFSSPKIIDCTIRGNQATEDGGGVEVDAGAVEIENCIIADNQASGFGGGIDCYGSDSLVLINCTLAGNSAGSGGGLCCIVSKPLVVKNCILWGNDAPQGPEIALIAHYSGGSIVTVNYSDVQGGQTAVHDSCEGLVWGGGNINADPCFASFNSNMDSNSWDLHLQSVYGRWDVNTQSWETDLNTSGCIDAGDPDSDWQDEIWPNGKRINMGAYGGTNQASRNGNRADFNVDGAVDFADFAEFSRHWMAEEHCFEDLTGNGIVNLADMVIFAENWLWQK
jgi:predicted outer membrane repeat protein